MNRSDRIFVAGHRGLVGSAIVRRLRALGYDNLLLRTRDQVDLTNAAQVSALIRSERPQYVFVAAARVGGIMANLTFPADFILENLAIELNLLTAAHENRVSKLLLLGSSCVYPRLAKQPIREDELLTGPLEPTNEPYAIAKIAGIKLAEAFRKQHGDFFFSVMPTNLYGPNDSFDPFTSHVLPALIRKFHEAKLLGDSQVTIWGTGTPRREFMHVDDLADACVFLMEKYKDTDLINIGVGEDITIRELAELVASVVGYEGSIAVDPTKPDGTPRKLLDVTRLNALGWRPKIRLRDGIEQTYAWFLAHADLHVKPIPTRAT